jgi:hypothetical protein
MSFAVASALAAAAGSAFALTPAQISAILTAPGGAISEVRMSGATAQDAGVTGVLQRLCTAGSLDAYSYTVGTTLIATAYVCNAGAPISKPLTVQKDSAVGSFNGVGPVKDGTSLTYIDVTKITTTNCAGPTAVPATAAVAPDGIGLPAYNKYACNINATKTDASDIGFSDVEPAIWGYDATGLQTVSPNQLLFGVPVTVALRNALQTAQGLALASETAANVPSLSSSELAAVYSQNVATADALGIGNTNDIYMVRRVDSSGTEKAAELFFLNQGVNLASSPMSMAPINAGDTGKSTLISCGTNVAAPTGGPGYVMGGNGTGDVLSCLTAHNSGGRYAIGIASMEKVQFGAGWRYVRVDGVLPTIANAIRGKYNYWTEQAMLSKTTIAGDALAVWNYYKTNLGSVPVVAALNQSFSLFDNASMGGAGEPDGQQSTGLMTPPVFGGTCPPAITGTVTADNSPININSKSTSGKPDNRVKPPVTLCPPRL